MSGWEFLMKQNRVDIHLAKLSKREKIHKLDLKSRPTSTFVECVQLGFVIV